MKTIEQRTTPRDTQEMPGVHPSLYHLYCPKPTPERHSLEERVAVALVGAPSRLQRMPRVSRARFWGVGF